MAWPEAISTFGTVWVLDFEFRHEEGARPEPRCLVARAFPSGEEIKVWFDKQRAVPHCPFGKDDLLVAYYAVAEVSSFLALGWQRPVWVLDLYTEARNFFAGSNPQGGLGLLAVCQHLGIHVPTTSEEKSTNRLLAQQQEFTEQEREQLLDYCTADVAATFALLQEMLSRDLIDLPRALLRGRYMSAATMIEEVGVPIDVETFEKFCRNWNKIKLELVRSVDRDFGVYEGISFREHRFANYCARNAIAWPKLLSGRLELQHDTFKEMARLHPQLLPLLELRSILGKLKLSDLTVGPDGRNRYGLGCFGSVTGRNQPSTTKAIFGPSKSLRSLIKPGPGKAVAYIDFEQQEFAIAAALSGDENMKDAYVSGDPYLRFAKLAGAVPPEGTKQSHPAARDLYKGTVLSTQYGSTEVGLSRKLNISEAHAKELLRHHRRVFSKFWRWSDKAETQGILGVPLKTIFGWQTTGNRKQGTANTMRVVNPLTFRNFPAQANGAEMLRIAVIGLVEAGIQVCAPIHDAVLIEADIEEIDAVVERAREIMGRASRAILNGFEVRTEANIIRYPDRFEDGRGGPIWNLLMETLERVEAADANAASNHNQSGQ